MVDCAPQLPFRGWAQNVDAVVARGRITNGSDAAHFGMPYVEVEKGADKDQVTLHWQEPVKGTVSLQVRMDDPA